ncbi:hypothetical protein HMPREF1024_00703 [Klebsiella sp. 4_1_44FAA]|nr:hypothetical protein HMPREF1024_00703 [Klebsiella sp. 4_1_44FAA]
MILSYLASRRRQRQAAIPALAHITPLSLAAEGVATAAP